MEPELAMAAVLAVDEDRRGGWELPPSVERVFGDLRGRIGGDLRALGFTDDDRVVGIEDGGVVRWWFPDSGRLERTQNLPLSELENIWRFNYDGTLLASAGSGIALWDVENGTALRRILSPDWTASLAFSDDGNWLATGHADCTVRIWDVSTGALVRTLKRHDEEVCALAFDPDGGRLASAAEDRTIIVWDLTDGRIEQRLVGHTDRIDSLAWSADGAYLASAGWDTSVRVWDVTTGAMLAMLNGQGECVHAVIFHADPEILICGDSDHVIRVWNWRRLEPIAEFQRHQGAVMHLALSPDGMKLASGGADRSIQFWDLILGEPVVPMEAGQALTSVLDIAVSRVGDLTAVHTEGRLSRWNIATAQPQPVATGLARITAVAYGPYVEQWALGLDDGDIAVGPAMVAAQPVFAWNAHLTAIRQLAYSPDGSLLASSASLDGYVRFWNPRDGEQLGHVVHAAARCTTEAMAFHPVRPILAVAYMDVAGAGRAAGDIVFWDYHTKTRLSLIHDGATAIAFSPDGNALAAVSWDESLVIYDVSSGQMLHELGSAHNGATSVAYDPRGGRIATASDQFVQIWNAHNGHLLATFDVEIAVHALAFVPDGSGLLTGNANGTCYLLSID